MLLGETDPHEPTLELSSVNGHRKWLAIGGHAPLRSCTSVRWSIRVPVRARQGGGFMPGTAPCAPRRVLGGSCP
uniref:Uncharacterized protein n=1 Tax=Nonomuraea gerenzanensis TaxID=93944 RepID=A0A1M4EJP3_9ACTN|nr:hypothetical protein BN4615_P8617 [Nonomuraea gerenzanensis]